MGIELVLTRDGQDCKRRYARDKSKSLFHKRLSEFKSNPNKYKKR